MPVRPRSATAALFACLALLTAPLAAQQGDPGLDRLEAEVTRLAELSGGIVGVAAVHLETGRAVYLNGTEQFPMASTFKFPVAVQILRRVEAGTLSLDSIVEIEPQNLHPGSGTLTHLFNDPGVYLSVRNLLELMLLISDNSAADIMLRMAGGPDSVNAMLAGLGVEGIRVDRPTSLLIADWSGVEGLPEDGEFTIEEFREQARMRTDSAREAAAIARFEDPRDTATPRGMADLYTQVWKGQALNPEHTELLLDILSRVETGTDRLKGLLPPRTTVGHKTGTLGGVSDDVGIIYLPDDAGHVITCVFVKEADDSDDRALAIRQIARAVYDYFLFNPG